MGAVDGCGGEAVALTRGKDNPHFSAYAAWEIHPVVKAGI
jgi:hypothetical protein